MFGKEGLVSLSAIFKENKEAVFQLTGDLILLLHKVYQ